MLEPEPCGHPGALLNLRGLEWCGVFEHTSVWGRRAETVTLPNNFVTTQVINNEQMTTLDVCIPIMTGQWIWFRVSTSPSISNVVRLDALNKNPVQAL